MEAPRFEAVPGWRVLVEDVVPEVAGAAVDA